jgi:uncharacterized protein YlbG (UPF0298 family)
MQKALELAKSIGKDLQKNWSEELDEFNLTSIFSPVYNSVELIHDKNTIVCYIVHAYNPDSFWLDLKKDRTDNKIKILNSLGADVSRDLYQNVMNGKHESVNISIFSFLEELKDWRWRSIFDLLEYASRMSRFAAVETEEEKKFQKVNKEGESVEYTKEVDIEVITKVNKEKGNLIQQSIKARENADLLLEQIRKEFVATDNAVQQDFNFSFTGTSKKKDVLSWRDFIKDRNLKKYATQ